ncbi:ABC transporter permease [Tropicimonas sediminicola]|uniref:Osmoprotectant transport system permease protein n=1 Tax=Tropicimonas sediminicola TaxID=1031541 RepID=A0A239D5Q3_9RHOB|nr:ABC transporter permease [Tropicimonas sediminicola]SNS27680.1 osmoprotectant transport system permease protein [Tropicimonas sediminicola]
MIQGAVIKQDRLRSKLAFAVGIIFGIGLVAGEQGYVGDIWRLYSEDITYLVVQHVKLVGISSGLAILVGIPAGILLSRDWMQRYSEAILQVFNIGTTVPTLAILALSITLLGIGFTPAVFGLWVATLLPIVRNVYQGLREVPAHLKEAATGMGMRPLHILRAVELPNALYVMFAGIRTAVAINVGTAPLAFLIGGSGLGELIFTGIDLNDMQMLLAGAIPTALLAMLADYLLGRAQYWLIPRGVNPLR